MQITPLRAYAHEVPRYYIQNFGNAISHPDTNEYAAFVQDTIRVTDRLALSLGVRYDFQYFTTKGLVINPLWPYSGHVPNDNMTNFAPRVGLAYSIGHQRPLVIRAGYGIFYTRIPQIYTSTVATDNGFSSTNLILDNNNYYDRQVFPTYPNPIANCALDSPVCTAPRSVAKSLESDIAAFAPNFKTPRVEQTSVSVEREVAHRLAVGINYMYVHGVDLIRARDVNLPPPVIESYPVYDDSGATFLGKYYDVDSFSTWQLTRTLTCPFPPCINHAGTAHSTTGRDQSVRERGLEHLPWRHSFRSPPHDQRPLLAPGLHLRARGRRRPGRARRGKASGGPEFVFHQQRARAQRD